MPNLPYSLMPNLPYSLMLGPDANACTTVNIKASVATIRVRPTYVTMCARNVKLKKFVLDSQVLKITNAVARAEPAGGDVDDVWYTHGPGALEVDHEEENRIGANGLARMRGHSAVLGLVADTEEAEEADSECE